MDDPLWPVGENQRSPEVQLDTTPLCTWYAAQVDYKEEILNGQS